MPHHIEVVDVTAPQSRSVFETALKLGRPTKIGDFTGSDLALSRSCAKIIKAAGRYGIAAPSAEASPFDSEARNFAFFETGHLTNSLMVDLVKHTVVSALDEKIALNGALRGLGIDAFF